MAKIKITNKKILSEAKRVKLKNVLPGRVICLSDPAGGISFYIVNKIPRSENLLPKQFSIPLTNLGDGRLVQKHSNLNVAPVSAEVLIKVFMGYDKNTSDIKATINEKSTRSEPDGNTI